MEEIQKYNKFMVVLHWLMALFVIYCMGSAILKGWIPKGDFKTLVMDYHKWFGMLVFLLVWPRIITRFMTKSPSCVTGNKLQDLMAKVAHLGLYLFMVIVPLCGILMMQYGGYQLSFFGYNIEQFTEINKSLKSSFKEIHEVLGFTFIGLVVLHFVAFLKHQFIDRDNLLKRMKF